MNVWRLEAVTRGFDHVPFGVILGLPHSFDEVVEWEQSGGWINYRLRAGGRGTIRIPDNVIQVYQVIAAKKEK